MLESQDACKHNLPRHRSMVSNKNVTTKKIMRHVSDGGRDIPAVTVVSWTNGRTIGDEKPWAAGLNGGDWETPWAV